MGSVTPITVIGELVAGESKQTRRELERLVKHLTQSKFQVGRLLHTIKQNGYYDGYTTFQDYVKTLDIKPRTAKYLQRIAETTEYLKIKPEVYEPVGIAKLREITSLDYMGEWTDPEGTTHLIAAFIFDMINKGLDMSLDEIKSHVRVLKGLSPDQEIVGMHFYVSRQVKEQVVDPAIDLARKQIGSTHRDDEGIAQDASDGACLEIISVSFTQDPANQVLAYEETHREWKLEDILDKLGDDNVDNN